MGKKMIKTGRINTLKIKTVQAYGVHLDGGEHGDILLLKKDLPEDRGVGDPVNVFVYSDREDRLRATTRQPFAMVGEFAKLQVVSTSAAGAFLAWGLDKDLLVPKSEQLVPMQVGKSYIVYVFLSDKTNRITASAKLEQFLGEDVPPYKGGEEVRLIIWGKSDLGYLVVVNGAYEGLIYKSEVFKKLGVGQELKGYVKKVRDDQKIDVILQRPGAKGVDDIAQRILYVIKENDGKIALTDRSKPEEIYGMFEVSKKVFKKAIGALYRKRLIVIGKDGIEMTK